MHGNKERESVEGTDESAHKSIGDAAISISRSTAERADAESGIRLL